MKKVIVFMLTVALMMSVGNAWAGDCLDCDAQATADIQPGVALTGAWVNADGNDAWAGGQGKAEATLDANASATGQDVVYYSGKDIHYHNGRPDEATGYWVNQSTGEVEEHEWTVTHTSGYFSKKYYHGTWKYLGEEQHVIAGEAEAFGRNELYMTPSVTVLTNGPQDDGLSLTKVHATNTLEIDGLAWAKGTDGCPQEATIETQGTLTSYGYGNSFSGDPNGAYASAGASGATTVGFIGHEQDASNYGFFSPNKAEVDFSTTITVDQRLISASYVSPDGTLAGNVAYVGGGYAQSNLGNDGSLFGFVYDRDNIELTGIQANGNADQYSRAIGAGGIAEGGSSASFRGAVGNVTTIQGGWCSPSPGQTANVGGYAFVAGYNNVDVQANSIRVTSVQYSKATTGNSGPAIQD